MNTTQHCVRVNCYLNRPSTTYYVVHKSALQESGSAWKCIINRPQRQRCAHEAQFNTECVLQSLGLQVQCKPLAGTMTRTTRRGGLPLLCDLELAHASSRGLQGSEARLLQC